MPNLLICFALHHFALHCIIFSSSCKFSLPQLKRTQIGAWGEVKIRVRCISPRTTEDNRNIMIGVGGLLKPSIYWDGCAAGIALDEARTLRHVPLSGTISVRSGCFSVGR
jgi:hypothetical protein